MDRVALVLRAEGAGYMFLMSGGLLSLEGFLGKDAVEFGLEIDYR